MSHDAHPRNERRHPELFTHGERVVLDELVDRRTGFARLAAGELDVAIVFEHEFAEDPAPDEIELVPLFRDPPRALLPAGHRLARPRRVTVAQLAGDTWIRAHHGSAADLVDHVLHGHARGPSVILAGHGDEPVEAQAFVAAGRGIMLAHKLNVLISPDRIAVVPVTGVPARRVQAAIMRDQHGPAARAVLTALVEIGRRY